MESVVTYFVILFLGVIKPGPGIAFFTFSTLSEGFKYAFIMLLGCATAHGLMVFLLLTGLDMSNLPANAMDYIQLVALIGIIFYGVSSFFKKPKSLSYTFGLSARKFGTIDRLSYFIKGTIWPFTNPFNYVIYAAMLPSLMESQALLNIYAQILLAFFSGLAVIAGVGPYMLVAKKAIRFLKSQKVQRNLDHDRRVLYYCCCYILAGLA